MVREHIRFTGKVQGVGFRYTCSSLAKKLGLTGWIRNDPDGAVTGEFQGTAPDIEALVTNLNLQRLIRVDWAERTVIPDLPNDRIFEVTN
jgi:acylphosphatase